MERRVYSSAIIQRKKWASERHTNRKMVHRISTLKWRLDEILHRTIQRLSCRIQTTKGKALSILHRHPRWQIKDLGMEAA